MVVNELLIGSVEDTTGYVHGSVTDSYKGDGVIALSMFDVRNQSLVDDILMAGTYGITFPGIRAHFQRRIAGIYRNLDCQFASFPPNATRRYPLAYRAALDNLSVITAGTPKTWSVDMILLTASCRHGGGLGKPR